MKTLIALIIGLLFGLQAHAAVPSASVSASRTSGTAPLCVSFDATGTTDADTSLPFHDLLYRWNFGDSAAGAWAIGSNASFSRNAARGPVVTHCYETAGTFSAKLQVTDGTSTSSSTVTIRVDDPNVDNSGLSPAGSNFTGTNTTCFYNSSVGAGCPSGATQTASSDFDAAVAACIGNGKRCLFKKGDSFARSSAGTIAAVVTAQIGAYGSGAAPTITGSSVTGIVFNNSSASAVTVFDLDIVGAGAGDTGNAAFSFTGSPQHITLLRVIYRDIAAGISVQSGQTLTNFYLIDSTCNNIMTAGGNCFFGQVISSGFLGNTIGPIPTSGGGEHGIRLARSHKTQVAHNQFNTPNLTKAQFLLRSPSHTGGASPNVATDTSLVVVSDNRFDAAGFGITGHAGGGPNGETNCAWGYDIIFERNIFVMGNGGAATAIINPWLRNSIRNNIFIQDPNSHAAIALSKDADNTCSGDPGADPTNAAPNQTGNVIVNNTMYAAAARNNFSLVYLDGQTTAVTNTTILNNLLYSPLATGSVYDDLPVGTVTGTTATNNSSEAQSKGTSPQFASGTPTTVRDFRVAVGSYATSGGVASFPATAEDFFLCRDRTGVARMGALVPAARAQCSGVAGQ